MNALKISPGMRFSRLLVIAPAPTNRWSQRYWACLCECGKAATVREAALRRGHTRSCGCLQREKASRRNWKHGGAGTAEYRAWLGAKARCYDSTNKKFADYGGRGITVCRRWRESFLDFLADVGKRPPGKTLDRWPNNDGNYEPGNVRWATPREQIGNRRPYDKTRSVETRAKIGEAFQGKPLSAEHRAKLSAAHKGKVLSSEHRAKLSAAQTARQAKARAAR